MQKIYGSPKRQDGLVQVGRHKYQLIYGFGKEHETDESGWNWRHNLDHIPTEREIKEIIEAHINALTAQRILNGFTWNGKPVWLSAENQTNLQRAYAVARDTDGKNLPLKYKLGESEDGSPVYHTFTKVDVFRDFMEKMDNHIQTAVSDGYNEKDGVDYTKFTLQ